jgi:superfamily II DNA or RNA helicase
VAEGIADQVHCQVRIVQTGVYLPMKAGSDKYFFGKMLNFLAGHQQRNDFLISYISAYAKKGHFCIAVSDRVNMLNYITDKLQKEGIAAQAFHRKAVPHKNQREQVLMKARNGEITVLVALRSMVLGLDIPRLTAFFNLTPSANPPNYYQELSRVRTPYEGKFMAYVVDFLDAHPVAKACMASRKKVYKKENFEVLEK